MLIFKLLIFLSKMNLLMYWIIINEVIFDNIPVLKPLKG